MKYPSSEHLEIVTVSAKELSFIGDAKVVYLTAELAPLSNAQRPDLYLQVDPDHQYFFELRLQINEFSIKWLLGDIEESLKFVKESLEVENLVYCLLLGSNVEISSEIKSGLRAFGVEVVSSVDSVGDFVNAVKKIVSDVRF